VRRADNLTTFTRILSCKLGASSSWNPQGLSRFVTGLLYLYSEIWWAGQRSQYSDLLHTGRSAYRNPVEARFSLPIQNGPETHPASCTMCTGSLLVVKRLECETVHPPISNAKFENGLELHLRLSFVGAQARHGVILPFSEVSRFNIP